MDETIARDLSALSSYNLASMARAASYHDLQAEGAPLRTRLASLDGSLAVFSEYLRAVRGWQERCQTAVAFRSPRDSAEFRIATGPVQRLIGYDWFPTPGWQERLDESLGNWIEALGRVPPAPRSGQAR